jgi:threonine dehydrogenase-like Zn-dependent dehydrogenase
MAAKDKFKKVFAIDPVAERLGTSGSSLAGDARLETDAASPIEMAEKYGAIPLRGDTDAYISTLKDQTDQGPDVVLEVVGNSAAHSLAIQLVRIGGIVASCGVHSSALTVNGDTAYNKNLKFGFGRCHVRGVFPQALNLLKKIGKETPELLDEFVQKKVGIDEAPEVSL